VKFGNKHEFKFGGRIERYHSDNVFFNCCKQGAWVYSSLDDFYADARDALANPEPHHRRRSQRGRYQNRYMNLAGLDKPSQPLTALYGGAYVGDNWRPKSNLTIMMGLRFDVPVFENTAYLNPNANSADLPRRERRGRAVRQRADAGSQHPVVAACRLQLRPPQRSEDADPRRHGRLHRPASLCLDLESAWQHGDAPGGPSDR
jgi:hypothetical protein